MQGNNLIKIANDFRAGLKAEGIAHHEYLRYCSHSANDPCELKPASDFKREVIGTFYPPGGIQPGTPPPWDKARNKIRFLPNDLSIWTGINGHGKSQFLGHIALDAMDKGLKVCIASLELKPRNLLNRLIRQASAMELPTQEYINAIHDWTNDKLWVYDFVGNTQADRLLEVFAYAKQQYGIDIFIIDSLMRCGIAEDDYNAQKDFVGKLCDFKNQHNCHVHLITHPRKIQELSGKAKRALGSIISNSKAGLKSMVSSRFNKNNDARERKAREQAEFNRRKAANERLNTLRKQHPEMTTREVQRKFDILLH